MADRAHTTPLARDDIETIAANSFQNFHAKGLDYLCLHRSAELTVKAYFYDCAGKRPPEVVCPHDHRYPFATKILSGESGHIRYMEDPPFAQRTPNHQCFEWMTPLNGGNGFRWLREAHLERYSTERYTRGDTYWCRADEVHTITITRPGTVLLLFQLADIVPADCGTSTYIPGDSREPPPLDGLYDRMTVDRARTLLAEITRLTDSRQP